MGGARGVDPARGRSRSLAAQRHGRLDLNWTSVRRDGRAHHDDARERAAPPQRPVRAHDVVRRRRNGVRDGPGERLVTPALTTTMREGGVALVTFDLQGESVNKLTRGVVEEFRALMDRVESDATIRAVVLISGKPELFIAGADIDGFLEL